MTAPNTNTEAAHQWFLQHYGPKTERPKKRPSDDTTTNQARKAGRIAQPQKDILCSKEAPHVEVISLLDSDNEEEASHKGRRVQLLPERQPEEEVRAQIPPHPRPKHDIGKSSSRQRWTGWAEDVVSKPKNASLPTENLLRRSSSALESEQSSHPVIGPRATRSLENNAAIPISAARTPVASVKPRADLLNIIDYRKIDPTYTPQHYIPQPASIPSGHEPIPDFDHQIPESQIPAIATGLQSPELCDEQAAVVNLVMSGKNVFFTGSAGTGKSTVLKEFVRRLKADHKDVRIVAPTGRAALDINGSTTWTYAGWNPDSMKKSLEDILKAAHGKFVSKRLRGTDVLVIDEISMVENFHFERLNQLMKEARGNSRPFGGVQLIVTGDFCQLPPVKPFQFCLQCGKELAPTDKGNSFKCKTHGYYYDIDKWAFRSQAWETCKFEHIHLKKIHRQSDEEFIKILQKCRISEPLSDEDKDILLNHQSDTKGAVQLFSTREEVSRINNSEFSKLMSAQFKYSCYDTFTWNSEKHPHLRLKGDKQPDGSLAGLRDHRYEPTLSLKVGMQVVLLANLDLPSGLVNGSQGKIVGFKAHEPGDIPKKSGEAPRTRDGGAKDEPRGGGGGAVEDYDAAAIKERNIHAFIGRAKDKQWPVVRFVNGVERAIVAECTVNEMGDERPYTLLSRTQIPLSAAWAMSIHKAQGMTLDRVIVDLSRAFEEGQLYVALSRARSLQGLKVLGLGSWTGRGNAQVKGFLEQKFGI